MGDETSDRPVTRRAEVILAGIALAFVVGLAVIGVASAMETSSDCSTYGYGGYGGYGCVNYEDAVLTVDPSTDLVDGRIVTVSGVAFDPPYALFAASQCVEADIGVGGQGNCDSETTTIRTVNSNGDVYFTMRVKRIIETPDLGLVDCAFEQCVIGAATIDPTPPVGGPSEEYVVLEGTTAPLSFDPDAPPINYEDAQIFVTPSEDLVDRQIVTVTGIDLDPHFSSFGVALCDASLLGEAQVDACDLSTSRISSVDGEGRAEIEMTVRRIITTAAGGEIDCAEPGACEIGGGTFSGFATAIEGARAPVQFDPDVPPVPPLEFEIDIDEVTANAMTGTATCNRDAELQVDFSVEQQKGGADASAYGYLYENAACGPDGEEFTISLMSGDRRLTGGPATYYLWAYAYDGFESAFIEDSDAIRLRGGPRDAPLLVAVDGVDTSIEIIGVEGRGAEQQVVVEVTCERYGEYVSLSASLRQWAGLSRVTAYAYAQLPECHGTHRVSLPIFPNDGVLVGGPAEINVEATLHDHRPPPDEYHDFASATGTVRLSGKLSGVEVFDPVPDPNSRITIDTVSRSAIQITIECDERVMVEVSGYAIQQRGRNQTQANGYDFVECDGTTSFEIGLSNNDGLKGGGASVSVSAYAYRIVPDENAYYEYVWDDTQQASVKVRGSG